MASFNQRNLVKRTASAPPKQIYDDVDEVKQSARMVPPPVAAKPRSPILVTRTASAPIARSEQIYDDVYVAPPVAVKPKSPIFPNLVKRTASAPIAESEEIYDDVIEVKQSAKIVPPPVATKPKLPAPLSLVTQTASGPIVNHNYEPEEIYDDVVEVKQSAQITPPPVAARPKSPNTEQTSRPIYGNVVTTKENTVRCLPPPVAPKRVSHTLPTERRNTLPAPTKSEQQVSTVTERRNTLPVAKNQQSSPVTVRKNTSNNNTSNVAALTKEIETKLQCPPSPVATRPKPQMSPVTAQRNNPLYNNTPSTVTDPLQRAPSPVVVPRVPKQRNSPLLDDDDINAISIKYTRDQLHGNTASRQAVSSPSHKIAPKQLILTEEKSNTDYYSADLHDGEWHGETELLHHPSHPEAYQYVVHESHDGALDMVQPAQARFSLMSKQPQITDLEANKAYLRSLSGSDVLQLLDNMNLSQHKASFQEEQIDGTILAELTKEELKELGVTKGVQLIRLSKLIEGTVSAKEFLERNYY